MKALLQTITYAHPRAPKIGFVRSRYSDLYELSDPAYRLLEEKQEIWLGFMGHMTDVKRCIVMLARVADLGGDIGMVLDLADEETYKGICEDAFKLLGNWKEVPSNIEHHYIEWAKKRQIFV